MTQAGHNSKLGLCLSDMVAPRTITQFLNENWERDSWLGRVPGTAEGLLGIGDIEVLSHSLSACKRDWIRLVRDARELPEDLYSTREGLVDIARVREAYNKGFTIQLSKMHKRFLPVGTLCRRLEQEFLAAGVELSDRIGAHAYLTPACSQGLGIHCDYQDVFVIQLAGDKRWRVWEWTDRYPIDQNTKSVRAEDLPALKWDLTLREGEVLYVPRGVFHEASTQNNHSLHLSLSVYPATWMDLFQVALRTNVLARAPLTRGVGCSSEKIDQIRSAFCEIGSQLSDPTVIRQAISQLRDRGLQALDPLPVGHFKTEPPDLSLTVNSRLRRTSIPFVVCYEKERVCLKWKDGLLQGNAGHDAAFNRIASFYELDVSDIPVPNEGERLALARELIRAGLFAAFNGAC